MNPKVSVVMACYKESVDWLELAVDSILDQTFSSLELIVVVDNPEHSSAIDLLETKRQTDNRLVVLINDQNMGLPKSLNRGFSNAKGEYFCRMDADDIASPERIEKQVKCLEADYTIGLLGTGITNIDSKGQVIGVKSFLKTPLAIEKAIQYRSVACHPTWLMRKSVYQEINGYRYFPSSEDYDFLYRVLDAGFKISNLSEPLLQYRLHDGSMTSALSSFQYQVKHYIQLLHKQRKHSGTDKYSEQTSDELRVKAQSNSFANTLVTKAREAEEGKRYFSLAIWGALAVLFSGAGLSRLKSFVGFNYIKWRYEN